MSKLQEYLENQKQQGYLEGRAPDRSDVVDFFQRTILGYDEDEVATDDLLDAFQTTLGVLVDNLIEHMKKTPDSKKEIEAMLEKPLEHFSFSY